MVAIFRLNSRGIECDPFPVSFQVCCDEIPRCSERIEHLENVREKRLFLLLTGKGYI